MKLRFRDDRGQALVELALVTPILTLLMLGAVELGRIAYFAIEVESAARAGASYGSVNVANAFGDPTTIQQAAMNDAPDLPNLVATPGTACVCETVYGTANTPPLLDPTSGTTWCANSSGVNPVMDSCNATTNTSFQAVVEYVTVSTSAAVDPLIHLPGLPTSFTLHGYCQMRVLQN